MRILSLIGVVFVFGLICFSIDASSETYNFDNLTVSKAETLTFSNDTLWVEGDILIDGILIVENCSLNINRTLDLTISEIRINSTGKLSFIDTTISTMENETYGFTYYTLVSDAGDILIKNSQIEYSMIWLVGGNANITNLSLNGHNIVNYGIFSEDTNLSAVNVFIQNYTLGLRSIGINPELSNISYYNCSKHMTQEWWVTFSPVEKSTNLPISGFEIRQWDTNGKMLGTWNWAKEYEVTSEGTTIFHTANFSSYLDLDFAYIEDQWNQQITENTHIIRNYNMNASEISYESATIFVDDIQLKSGQIVPKWSVINISIVVDNPTDLNFNNLYLDLDINGEPGFAKTSLELFGGISVNKNLTWIASIEGPLSLGVKTTLIVFSTNNSDDINLSLSKFVEVETSSSVSKESGAWGAFIAIFALLCLCCYIVYNEMEDEGIVDNSLSKANKVIDERSEDETIDDMEEE